MPSAKFGSEMEDKNSAGHRMKPLLRLREILDFLLACGSGIVMNVGSMVNKNIPTMSGLQTAGLKNLFAALYMLLLCLLYGAKAS